MAVMQYIEIKITIYTIIKLLGLGAFQAIFRLSFVHNSRSCMHTCANIALVTLEMPK